jgi:endonuclease/exonuclease/phosphatase family metal-dependent hydrolase
MIINVLSYNISWATQANKMLGSEADFVEACQKAYKTGGLQCIKNALTHIGKLELIDLMGLQEVNSAIEPEIMKVQPNLKKFERGIQKQSIISILWNPEIFGEKIYSTCFNLMKSDDRPCLILITKKNEAIYVLINLHMPWSIHRNEATNNLNKFINTNKNIKQYMSEKIIMMGDFNDPKTSIHLNNPYVITLSNNVIKLSHILTKTKARKTLKSCCWHKPKHKYKYFSDSGDYILVNKNIKQKSIKIPASFRKKGRTHRLFSDHMPVLSVLQI